MMRFRRRGSMSAGALYVLAGSSLLLSGSVTTVSAQTAAQGFELEEIVVTARRRDESLQDVPQTVNAVTGTEIEKLNFRDFKDVQAVVPGLAMSTNANGIGASASVRGVNYDVNASGNNGTIEFYMNDAPISAGNLFQTVYDIQQIELLRGPQGTLRGRASPSGSMTVTTRRPDLAELGGYVNASGNDIGGYNGQGAFGIPLFADKLAIRVAGAYDVSEGSQVESVNSNIDPENEAWSGRATIYAEPTDNLSLTLIYQKTALDVTNWNQVESQQVLFPGAPVILGAGGSIPPFIRSEDRLAVHDAPRYINQDYENINFQFKWAFAGQALNYVGARNNQTFTVQERADIGNYFPSTFPAALQNYGQFTDSGAKSYQHELRLSSEERLGIFDYSVGAFFQEQESPTSLTQATAVFIPVAPPAGLPAGVVQSTPISRDASTEERSVFTQLTAHIGDNFELAGGVRYIEFESKGSLFVAGNRITAADQDDDDDALIYALSGSYRFSEDLMVYANTGTSWRPGANAVGDFSLARTPLENSFIDLDPEKSTSYEVGFKMSGFDNRLRTSLAAYYQDFENYPYRSASGVYFRDVAPQGPQVSLFNFIAAVPVEVIGVEGEIAFAPLASWDIALSASVSKGEIKEGVIPCTDVNPRDGISDVGAPPPALLNSAAAFSAASGGDNLSACTVTQRSSSGPQWSSTLNTEYRVPFGATLEGYARGLLSLYGNSKNDPTNAVDDYDAYELLNVYIGIRDANGVWDVALYGKNITETEEVLTRSASTLTTPYRIPTGPTSAIAVNSPTNYYGGLAGNSAAGLTMTPAREFGMMVRYSFGSR